MGAGANVDRQMPNGATPLYMTATRGNVRAFCVLLGANAVPSLECKELTPLETGGGIKQLVVSEILRLAGLDDCGGPTRGGQVLKFAADPQQLHLMAMLSDGGVLDTDGEALCAAVTCCRPASIKVLIKFQTPHLRFQAYVNFAHDNLGNQPLSSAASKVLTHWDNFPAASAHADRYRIGASQREYCGACSRRHSQEEGKGDQGHG